MPGYAALAEPWWIPVLFIVAAGHITNICVTLYLHRSATHGGVKFHPAVEHFMRFWIWLTTAQVTKEWVAVHRKHHAFADREGDPHSPALEGLWPIVFGQVFFYRQAAADLEVLDKYGKGTPEDWVERNVYSRFSTAGPVLLLLIDVFLFGALTGLLVWIAMAIWMPLLGGVINGIGHALGYRNFETKDESRNIYPWGIWIVGEELHNNHHADPRSAKFKGHWWEFDIGWIYIRVLALLKLADVVYARSASAKEFAARHYQEKVAEPVAARIDRAGAGLERARSQARERVERLRTGAHEELEQARERLDQAVAQARAAMDQLQGGASAEVGQARERLDQALDQARAAVDQARNSVERAARGLERAGGLEAGASS